MSEADALTQSPTDGPETTLEVGAPLPRLAAVRPLDGHRVAVTWANGPRAGATEEVDVAPVVMTLKFYAPLRADPRLFDTVVLADDGHTLVWCDPGARPEDRIDMAATTVERLAARCAGRDREP